MPARKPRILVVGLGNDLLQDDGVGVHAARELSRKMGRRAVAVGTAVLDAMHLIERAERVIAIDAMQAGGEPGTVYRFGPADVAPRDLTSMHELTFLSSLEFARKRPEEIVILGVEPQAIEFGMELTPAVKAALPLVMQTVETIVADWEAQTSAPR